MDLSRTKTSRATTSAGILAALLLTGCPLFEPPAAKQSPAEAEADPAAYAETVDAKLRRYSACRDAVASILSASWERYSDQVASDGKPKRRREGVYLRGIADNNFRSCRRLDVNVDDGVPMPIIEKSAAELIEAASRYAQLTQELEQYTDDEGWKQDNWQTLAIIDPQLRESHQQWAEADEVLQRAIDMRHIENDQLLLGVLERRVGRLEFISRKVMIHARPLVRCLEREPTPAYQECRPLFDSFDAVQGTFEEIYGADPEADKVFWMSTFANDVTEFHEVAGDLVRKLGQKRVRASDLQNLRDAYSSLVRDAETLDFDFP